MNEGSKQSAEEGRMADSVSTRPRQEGDFRCLGRAGQGQLSAKPGNSHCRAMSGRSLVFWSISTSLGGR